MEGYRHRKSAKAVGWINLAFTIIQLVILVGVIIQVATILSSPQENYNLNDDPILKELLKSIPEDADPEQGHAAIKFGLQVTIIFATIAMLVQLLAAISLLMALRNGTSARRALTLISIWRWITITFILLNGISVLASRNFIYVVVLLLPILFLVLMRPFVKELTTAL